MSLITVKVIGPVIVDTKIAGFIFLDVLVNANCHYKMSEKAAKRVYSAAEQESKTLFSHF